MSDVKRRGFFGLAAGAAVVPAAVSAAPMVEMHEADVAMPARVPPRGTLTWDAESGTLTYAGWNRGREWFWTTTHSDRDYAICLREMRSVLRFDGVEDNI